MILSPAALIAGIKNPPPPSIKQKIRKTFEHHEQNIAKLVPARSVKLNVFIKIVSIRVSGWHYSMLKWYCNFDRSVQYRGRKYKKFLKTSVK